ncbi:MAG TPA: VWA domain-containing protein [Usitatibacter sp.]|nr:VWA domain-containing protein [Usitatibacter sp.]
MTPSIAFALPKRPGGRLAQNVVHFARVLRAGGIPIGTDKVMDAVRVLPQAGLARREDWHDTLAALFVTRREQQALFDEAFERFWRDPAIEERVRALLLPKVQGRTPRAESGGRLAEALHPARELRRREIDAPPEVTVDATLTFSASERLGNVDFERMTSAEWAEAKRAVAGLRLPVPEVRARRYAASRRGSAIDLAATLRLMARRGGEIANLARRERRLRPPPLVVLCDISGSMHRYTRMFLHFLHALARPRPTNSGAGSSRVTIFLFGTRLTNVTRPLRDRDVDEALAKVAGAVQDWAGGTRIAASLREFNFRWARRLLGQNACVLLLTDGLERHEEPAAAPEALESSDIAAALPPASLAAQMDRLHRSCRRLVWLNPLLRYAGFEPRASGIASMLPHVDEFVPMHNLDSLRALAASLAR